MAPDEHPAPHQGSATLPKGPAALRMVTMPADTNPNGDIFGGWLLAQMDLAGSIPAVERAQNRVATVAVDAMSFLAPVFVGDVVSMYADVERVGRTSIKVRVTAYAQRRRMGAVVQVTQGCFTYVAVDPDGKPKPLPPLADQTLAT